MALCTQTQVEQRLQIDFTVDPDPVVTELIAAATAHIEAEVGRPIESDSYVDESYDGGRVSINLKNWPVTAISAVSEDGDVLAVDDDYLWRADQGRLLRVTTGGYLKHWLPTKPQTVVVSYTAGYLSPDHDSELAHLGSICAEMVARAFRTGADNAAVPAGAAGAIQSVTLQGLDTVTYASSGGAQSLTGALTQFVFLTEDEQRQLHRYRRPSFGFA